MTAQVITIKELCRQAGVNRSTFYLHYETIDDLVNETLRMIDRRFLSYFPKREEDVLRSAAAVPNPHRRSCAQR